MKLTVTFDLTALYFVAVNTVAILLWVLVLKHPARVWHSDGATSVMA